MKLQAVNDPPTDQNFRQIEQRFPIQAGDLAAVAPSTTSLPTNNLFIGKLATFKAAERIYWLLSYTGEASYPWAKIGGPPLRQQLSTEGTVTTAFKTENAPSITLPAVAMEFDATYGARLAFSTGELNDAQMVPFIDEVEQTDRLRILQNAAGVPPHHTTYDLKAAAGKVVRIKYKATAVTGTATLRQMYLAIDPIRVG